MSLQSKFHFAGNKGLGLLKTEGFDFTFVGPAREPNESACFFIGDQKHVDMVDQRILTEDSLSSGRHLANAFSIGNCFIAKIFLYEDAIAFEFIQNGKIFLHGSRIKAQGNIDSQDLRDIADDFFYFVCSCIKYLKTNNENKCQPYIGSKNSDHQNSLLIKISINNLNLDEKEAIDSATKDIKEQYSEKRDQINQLRLQY